jgi:cell division protein FtsA
MRFKVGASDLVTGLDIGTAAVKVVVAEARDGKPKILHAGQEPTFGLRKGAIVDIGEVSQAVRQALAPVKQLSKRALGNIFVSLGTPQVKMQASRGIVAVSSANGEIYQGDVERAVKASQAVNLGQNRAIIHTLTTEFIVDGVGDIADPLGLTGSRLETQSFILDCFTPHVSGLLRAIELAGGEVGGLLFSPLVAARAALSKRQKDLGAMILDLGAGTTGMAVYEENRLLGTAKFPIGAANVSNDLAIGLKVPVDAAEEIKLHYGAAFPKEVSAKDQIELKEFAPDAKGTVARRFVAEIISSRLEEIFALASEELKRLGKAHDLPGGVILVGGGAKLPGLTDLAKQELRLSAQIGCTLAGEWQDEGGAFKATLEDPEFVCACGLALWGIYGEHTGNPDKRSAGFNLKNWFKYFAP